jgi:hypothetical protein
LLAITAVVQLKVFRLLRPRTKMPSRLQRQHSWALDDNSQIVLVAVAVDTQLDLSVSWSRRRWILLLAQDTVAGFLGRRDM